MNNNKILLIFAVAVVLTGCTFNNTKTFYGTWMPVFQSTDSVAGWKSIQSDFLLAMSGSCEEMKVEKVTIAGTPKPDIEFTDTKCYGESNRLTFTDSSDAEKEYDVKLDITRDTLIGTIRFKAADGVTPVVEKIKMARMQ